MSFNTALSAPNLVTLRGSSTVAPTYAGSVYLSACPNTNVYTARVNQVSFTASFAQVTYDGGSGTLADVVDGMTVLISHTNDRTKAFFTGRVRKAPTSTILYVNETSAAVADNDYIFVTDDFAIRDKLGRMVSGVLKHDYEISFRQLLPFVYNIKSAYADWINTVSNVYTIAFAPLAVAATSGATISSWAWDVADGTITVGSSSTQNITATFPQGFRWVYLTVTDSGSRAIVRKIPVWAHGSSYAPELIVSGNLQVSANVAGGVDATVSSFTGVDTILDNTLLVAWSAEEIYQDATGSLVGNNIAFVGRIRKHTDTTRTDEQSSIDSERQYTVEGALTQLARIEQLPYEMLNDSTPTLFGQIANLTLWRGITYLLSECSTFLELHSLYFDDTTNDYLAPTRNPVGNILNAINDLAGSINSALQMNYSGQCEIFLDLRMATTAQRSAAVTVAAWTQSDILDVQLDHAHVRTVGRLKASGGSYNSTSNLYATYESLAPGVAQDYPEGTSSLDKQVLRANQAGAVAQLELNTRAGHAFERAQEVDTLTVLFPDGYHSLLIPALNQWHTFTIDDDAINILLDSTIRWLLTEVNTTHNSAEGTKEVRAIFSRETAGAPGQTVTYPVVAEVPLLEPTFLPFEPYPVFPIDMSDLIGTEPVVIVTPNENTIPDNGNAIIVATASQCLVVVNALLTTTPGTRDVTPDDMFGQIYDGIFGFGKDFYLLVSDGEYSYVYYTEDIFAGDVIWTASEQLEGEFVKLAKTQTQGELYVLKKQGGDAWCEDFDFTIDEQGWDFTEAGFGTYTAGVGFTGQGYGTGGGVSRLNIVFANAFLTSITITHTASGYGGFQKMVVLQTDSDPTQDHTLDGPINGTNIVSTYNEPGFSPFECDSVTLYWDGASSFAMTITSAQICGVGFNPFTGTGGDVSTRFSDDFAATFAAEEAVAAFGDQFIGMDTSKIGSQILIATDGQTQKASAGGVYASYGSALPAAVIDNALFIPRYVFGSSSSGNTGANPEYLLHSAILNSGQSMWKVTASGVTFSAITPIRSAAEGLAVSHRCIAMWWRTGSKIVAIAEFGGSVRRLCCSDDSGATWTFSGALSSGAVALTTRKSDIACKQVFLTNGNDLGICFDAFAATPLVSNRNLGLSDNLVFCEVYG